MDNQMVKRNLTVKPLQRLVFPPKQSTLRKRLGDPLASQGGQRRNHLASSPKPSDKRSTPGPAPVCCIHRRQAPYRTSLERTLQKHDKPLGTDPPQSSHVTDVAVDGSHKERTLEIPARTAGGVAYLVKYTDGRREIHMADAIRTGDKDALDSEVTAATLSLRLKSLHKQTPFTTSWDCLNSLRHLWRSNPICKPATDADTQTHHHSADEIATLSRQSQLRRLSELLTRYTDTSQTHTFKHQKAHKYDTFIRPLIINSTINATNQVYIIDNEGTNALIAEANEIQPAPTAGEALTLSYDAVHVTFNAHAHGPQQSTAPPEISSTTHHPPSAGQSQKRQIISQYSPTSKKIPWTGLDAHKNMPSAPKTEQTYGQKGQQPP
ncbi:hypothetical protein T492DRAFT_847122 [Pavlovales sp. CCMP2436]|nr:hypothetical protein T492DRAFT_847122 [Pavlovales sp. CCMP2436]